MALLLGASSLLAQSGPNLLGLEVLRARFEREQTASRHRALVWAERTGTPTFMELPGGGLTELVGFNGWPIFLTNYNYDAATTVSRNKIDTGGGFGYSLTGSGMNLGIWDGGGVETGHVEFGSRATQRDVPTGLSDHATHVAGTMVARGWNAFAKGMAYTATLDAYDWNSDLTEMATAAAAGLALSNHSYGAITGWAFNLADDGKWVWYGNRSISQSEDAAFGRYSDESRDIDDLVYTASTYLPVVAAANDRFDGPASQPVSHWVYDTATAKWVTSTTTRGLDGGTSGFDCLPSGFQTAKNPLVVAAVEDLTGGWISAATVVSAGFSSQGPTDDGRIKPDISANGTSLYSSITGGLYDTKSGTSMAAPGVTGVLGLLVRHYQQLNAVLPRGATTKAIAIHTADEAGNTGPDYTFGWGLLNALKGAQLISNAYLRNDMIFERTLTNGATWSRSFISDGTTPLRATLVWADKPGTPVALALDPSNKMLAHDLDIRLKRTSGVTSYPYRLSRTAPTAVATVGDNSVDNVEQINLNAPPAGTYTVTVSHKGALSASQPYTVIISGHSAPVIKSVSVTPNRSAWSSGVAIVGLVTLDSSAPKGGAKVTLKSNSTSASVPASVIVPEGQTTKTFDVTMNSVSASTLATITATYDGVSKSALFLVNPAGNDAYFVAQTVPPTLGLSQTTSVSVTMQNVGTTTWFADPLTGYALRAQAPDGNGNWSVVEVPMPAGSPLVLPGGSRTFVFNITSPAVAGTYNFQWRMKKISTGNFGGYTKNIPIPVDGIGNDSKFVSQSVPSFMVAGGKYTVSVTFRNQGTASWIGGGQTGYGLRSQNFDGNTRWGLNAVWMATGATTPPGADRTFTFTAIAPLIPGVYNFQWRMRQAGIGNFGEVSPNVAVVVN